MSSICGERLLALGRVFRLIGTVPRALILGVNGQDGSYLAEALLARGYDVLGVARDAKSKYTSNAKNFSYAKCDLRDRGALHVLVSEFSPDFAFHFASVHGSAGFQYEAVWHEAMLVNVSSLHLLLEYAREARHELRIIYAGSKKIYPEPLTGIVTETTPARPTCLYGITKMAARDLIFYYSEHHRVAATNVVLFNHESPRRPAGYLLPTLLGALHASSRDRHHRTRVHNLGQLIDWGCAREFMDIIADIAERSTRKEIILASGRTILIRDFAEKLFLAKGLSASEHIIEAAPSSEADAPFEVSLESLISDIGRRPHKTVYEVAGEMLAALEADFKQS